MSANEKMCPMLGGNACEEDGCEWWLAHGCAVKVLAAVGVTIIQRRESDA